MGSQNDRTDPPELPPLPDATSETLVLARATASEKRRTWTLNFREWGGALSLDQYLAREAYGSAAIPLARDGGMAHWILTTTTTTTTTTAKPPGTDATSQKQEQEQEQNRPVLASCETLRKRVLVARPPSSGGSSGGGGGGDAESGGVVIQEAVGYGIGSVYTYPEYRGRSYAKRMLKELGVALKTWPREEQSQGQNGAAATNGERQAEPDQAVCSALWSDIGKVFYAEKGWIPFPSAHVSFPSSPAPAPGPAASLGPSAARGGGGGESIQVEPITYANLPAFAARDEALLRRRLARAARRARRPAFAFAPDHDALRWHLCRDAFIAAQLFTGNGDGKKGAAVEPPPFEIEAGERRYGGGEEAPGEMRVKGVAATVASGGRVWAVWARNFAAPPGEGSRETAKNTLYILRLVVEGAGDEDSDFDSDSDSSAAAEKGGGGDGDGDGGLRDALAAVIGAARGEAARWGCGRVDLWNPTPLVRRLLEGIGSEELPREWVDRDKDSIPSLMWYGSGAGAGAGAGAGEGGHHEETTEGVEWVANEKYCWC